MHSCTAQHEPHCKRRDIKNCMDQRERAIACGDVPLVSIPILGRAIRVYGEWHALCAWCGCLAKISPDSRSAARLLHAPRLAAPRQGCRRRGLANSPTARLSLPYKTRRRWHVQVEAGCRPCDTGGPNAVLRRRCVLPGSLALLAPTAHQSMRTSEIFAHICSKARPMIGADKDTGGDDGMLAEQRAAAASAKPKRTRAMKSIDKKLNQHRRNRQAQQH